MLARISLSAVSLAVAATLVFATPAAAAPFTDGDVILGGTTWSVGGFESGNTADVDDADRDDWDGNSSTFDSGLTPRYLPTGELLEDNQDWECAGDGDRSTASDSTGDEIIICDLVSVGSGNGMITGSYELRFFADGATVRARLIVTNESASTVTGAFVGFDENYYQDDDTRIGASTTAGHPAAEETVVVNGDRLWITYDAVDSENYETPVVLTAAGTADAAVLPVMGEGAGNGDDDQETMYGLPALAPGDTIEIVQFYVWNFFAFDPELVQVETPAERPTVEVVTDEGFTKSSLLEPAALFVPSALAAVEESWDARSRFDTLSARDAAGIADPSQVLNWNPVAEELAETGPSDSLLPLVAFAGLLLLAGAGVIAVRRRPVSAR